MELLNKVFKPEELVRMAAYNRNSLRALAKGECESARFQMHSPGAVRANICSKYDIYEAVREGGGLKVSRYLGSR